MKTFFYLSFLVITLGFSTGIFAQESPCDLDENCQASDEVIFTTGYDPATGTILPPGLGAVDPSWRLINNPPLVGCTNTLQSTINGNGYLVNHNFSNANGWVNQPGATTIAPVDLGTNGRFGCNNLPVGSSAVVPYIFERSFCVCQDEEVEMDLTFRGDDTLRFELIDLISDAVIASSPGYLYPDPTQSFSYNGLLPAGSYALRAYLMNTNSVTLGFSAEGSLKNLSGQNTILSGGACCTPNPSLVISKILDNDCNGEVSRGDEVGVGWEFAVIDSAGFQVARGTTDMSGNYIISNLPAGTYTVNETPQPGWSSGTPASGSTQVVVGEGINQLYFFNCPQLCGEIVRDTLGLTCDYVDSIDYTFEFLNNSGLPVTAIRVKNISPSGVSITAPGFGPVPGAINLIRNPVPDGSSYGPVTFNIGFPGPITEPTEVCFTVEYIANLDGEEGVCCTYEHCITILPPGPCSNISADIMPTEEDPCCFDLTLYNGYCPDFFTGVITEIITPGVTFGSLDGGTDWQGALSTTNQMIRWRPASGTTLPVGPLPPMSFCFNEVSDTSQSPQQIVIHWLNGQDVVCSDTLEVEGCLPEPDVPCGLVEVLDVTCNDDGTISFTYKMTNLSNDTINSVMLQSLVADLDPFLDEGLFILPGGMYTRTVTINPLGGSLAPGTVVPIKLAMLNEQNDECCHLEFSITIPDCGQGCKCEGEDEWRFLVSQGLSWEINCEEGIVQLMGATSACDTLFIELFGPDGSLIGSSKGAGDQKITLPIAGDGIYRAVTTFVRYDENGEVCFEAEQETSFEVNCSNSDPVCDCEDDTFPGMGFTFNVDCVEGIVTATAGLTECDEVTLRILSPNGVPFVEETFLGSGSYTFPLPANGTYLVEMEAFRFDDTGMICREAFTQQELVVDCTDSGWCGTEAEFIEVIEAGYTTTFACEGVAGPVVSFTPVSATQYDQIDWRIVNSSGVTVFMATTNGLEGINVFLTEVELEGNFTVETRWERFDENGDSCFGFIVRRQTITNECTLNAGPIDMSLAVKENKEVAIQWSVDFDVSYDKYFVLRENDTTSLVIAEVEAIPGQTFYQYTDEKPLSGENKYAVFGFIKEKEAGRSRVGYAIIQPKTKIEVEIMPNPATQYIDLQLTQSGNYQVIIRDELGRILQRKEMYLDAFAPRRIAVSDYPDGMLFVQLIGENGASTTKRLIKMK